MKPLMLTALAATGALTATAAAALPLGGPAIGGSASLALTGAGMVAFGLAIRRQRRAAAAAERPATPIVTPALAPIPRFFPDGGPHGRVVPFSRRDGTVSEARQTRDLLRRAERVCAATRARVDEIR
ncbi:MAG: hypothetical protein ACREEI_09290 [Stellaceae bacterium]